jgi:hypothetical protein
MRAMMVLVAGLLAVGSSFAEKERKMPAEYHVSINGQELINPWVIRTEEDGVVFRHDGGVSKLYFKDDRRIAMLFPAGVQYVKNHQGDVHTKTGETDSSTKVSAAKHKANLKIIEQAKKVGFVKSVNESEHSVVVNTSLWKQMEYTQRGGIVMTFSEYFEYKTDLGHVTIKCNMTDKKLASFGTWRGLKVYE